MTDFGIIAAGFGARIIEDGSRQPKPLLEIDGEPMLGRLINIMVKGGAKAVSIVVNNEMPEVIDFLKAFSLPEGCELKIKEVNTPSSMHSFYELLQLIKPTGKFVVTTVDSVFGEESFLNYVEYFNKVSHGVDGVMGVTSYIDDESPLYVETEGRHRITAFRDHYVPGCKYISAGVYGLNTFVFPVLQQCINSGIFRMRNFQRSLLENGFNLDAYDLGKVIDVDHISDVAKANDWLVNKISLENSDKSGDNSRLGN